MSSLRSPQCCSPNCWWSGQSRFEHLSPLAFLELQLFLHDFVGSVKMSDVQGPVEFPGQDHLHEHIPTPTIHNSARTNISDTGRLAFLAEQPSNAALFDLNSFLRQQKAHPAACIFATFLPGFETLDKTWCEWCETLKRYSQCSCRTC